MEFAEAVGILRKDRDTPEARAAFRQMLAALFEEYQIEGQEDGGHGPRYWRQRALIALEQAKDDSSPARAVYYASDTGVPNELLAAAYTLIFG